MSSRTNRSKYYDEDVSFGNTPYLREKTLIICASFLFSGINLLAFGVLATEGTISRYFIFTGIVMLFVIPLKIWDKRREMRGPLAAWSACMVNLAVCVMLSYIASLLWMIVYAGEMLLIFGVVVVSVKRRKR